MFTILDIRWHNQEILYGYLYRKQSSLGCIELRDSYCLLIERGEKQYKNNIEGGFPNN